MTDQTEKDILNEINYFYNPSAKELMKLTTNNIVLFKATKETNYWENEDEILLVSYYAKTKYNNLDSLIPSRYIDLHEFQDSHFSWTKNKNTVNEISDIVHSKIMMHGKNKSTS